jgi:hypothetical protein
MRQRRVAAGKGLSNGLSTTIKLVRHSCFFAECSFPDAVVLQVHEAGNIYSASLLICRVFFSCCGSVASPQAAV